ncbi:hypothetical protein [Roseibium sediminicola]|uniref:Uncharacterized protein n=1 Tax=Roseibium sediminicola TaxID=2933272 RepID=A0ABT0H200_9HYPH|nr:hypothetical protein [Roseibium sp. CAU 1639]MCK7615704.1 hypothetical protein [Roseibium sp. CAU 1639]
MFGKPGSEQQGSEPTKIFRPNGGTFQHECANDGTLSVCRAAAPSARDATNKEDTGSMSSSASKVVAVGLVAVTVGYFLVHSFRGTGPLETARAESLLAKKLQYSGTEDVYAIAPDGEFVQATTGEIKDYRAIGCPKLGSDMGTLPGRYGTGGRTYGVATFVCLLKGKTRSGIELFTSMHVYRSADPARKGLYDGHLFSFQREAETRALMQQLKQATRHYEKSEQSILWAILAADGIYVPADKTQKSPIEKAVDLHLKRLSGQ